MPPPIYTADNCSAAYQLLWSYSLFWGARPTHFDWFEPLKAQTEADGIRLLRHQFETPNVSHFLVSTKPPTTPLLIVQRIKGRLQHLLGAELPKAFRRNYSLRSVGSTRRDELEQYLEKQCRHHPMADERLVQRLAQYQIVQPRIDGAAQRTSHAIYWHNLHMVIVNADRWMETRHDALEGVRSMLLRASDAKGHLLSRAGIVPDHLHLTLGCGLEESPQSVGLSYLNNLAYVLGMKPVFQFGYYVGTFGEFDVGVIPREEEL